MRNISSDGEEKIVQWEGEVLHAYDDFDPKHRPVTPGIAVRGTLTIGVGHVGPDVRPGMKITKAESRALLRKDLDAFERAVENAVVVALNDNQFAALVSFAFNVGQGNFLKSTLLKKLNAGNYAAVPTELMKWTKSKGKQMQGLVNRRAQEAALWGKGEFVSSASVEVKPDNVWTKPDVLLPIAGAGATAAGGVTTAIAPTVMASNYLQIALSVGIVAIVLIGAYYAFTRIRASS